MQDIRVEMWYENGQPVNMTLYMNGVPVARQLVSDTGMQNGKRTIMLDETMNSEFQRPPAKDLCRNCERYHYPERVGCYETDPCPDQGCLVSGPHEGWLHEDEQTRWGNPIPFDPRAMGKLRFE